MDPTTKIKLVKILPQKYAKDFLDGDLYFNTAAYFSQIDSADAERFDGDEGAAAAWQVTKVEMMEPKIGEFCELEGVRSPLIYRDGSFDDMNVLCVYAMTNRNDDHFDERISGFGDTAIVINDIDQFISRLKDAAAAEGKAVVTGPITYVDRETYDGPMGPFKKFSALRHQNEFRFGIRGGNGSACRLNIGDIRDITLTYSTAQMPAFWQYMKKTFG